MNAGRFRNVLTPDVIAALLIIVISALLLSNTAELPAESSLIPSMILRVMIVLAVVLGSRDLVRNWKTASKKEVFKDRGRFLRIVGTIVAYAIAVDVIGFYSSTIIMLPATAFLFGYRHTRIVVITTISLVGALLVLFTLLMGRSFPSEFFLR